MKCEHRYTLEGRWSKAGAFYVSRCDRCGHMDVLTPDRFFALMRSRLEATQ